ncbi:hypothetical protein [Streptomyces sp. DH12]|uniref:hypothetical protein n=1 Tax=Streptomyces sp. DH12 TaxID=2857010 RepID=UPI001E562791|nr:hypothetical protein [Streptomyces sp. DH12]
MTPPATEQDTGRSAYCHADGHEFCHPQDVYVQRPGGKRYGPVLTLTCTCRCHRGKTRRARGESR